MHGQAMMAKNNSDQNQVSYAEMTKLVDENERMKRLVAFTLAKPSPSVNVEASE